MKIKNTLNRNDSMQFAINLLNETGKKICFVLSEEGLLEGVVTDSEIRRALINGMSADSLVFQIMNDNPIFRRNVIDENKMKKEIDRLGIYSMPIIDEQGKLIDAIYGSFAEQKEIDNTTVFILAGGFGTRLGELTRNTPKPMLKVDGKPMLERIISTFSNQGFSHFVISTYYLAEQILEYFGDGSELGVSISYTQEEIPLGTAGSLSLLIGNENIKENLIIINGDVLTNIDFRRLISHHQKVENIATVCVKEYEFTVPYGVCNIKQGQLLGIEEKPNYKFVVNTGIYVLNSKTIEELTIGQSIDMPDFILNVNNKNNNVGVYPIFEYWLDIGKPEDFKAAQLDVKELN